MTDAIILKARELCVEKRNLGGAFKYFCLAGEYDGGTWVTDLLPEAARMVLENRGKAIRL